eukprot:1150399-Pelagomonas_calceolata.AAC.9
MVAKPKAVECARVQAGVPAFARIAAPGRTSKAVPGRTQTPAPGCALAAHAPVAVPACAQCPPTLRTPPQLHAGHCQRQGGL